MSTGVPSVVKFVVTPELYNTKHRAVAVGSATVWTRVGGECVVGRNRFRQIPRLLWTRCEQLFGTVNPTTALAIMRTYQPRNMRAQAAPITQQLIVLLCICLCTGVGKLESPRMSRVEYCTAEILYFLNIPR